MERPDTSAGLSTRNLKNLLNKEETEMPDLKDLKKKKDEANADVSTTAQEASMDALLDEAQQEAASSAGATGTTNLFDQSTASAAVSATDAEKAAAKAQRDAKVAAHNEKVRRAKANVISKDKKELTPGQAQFQAACQANFVLEALIYENGPKVRVNMSRKASKTNGEYDFLETAETQDRERVNAKGSRKGLNLFDYVKATTTIAYGLSGPTKLRGGIVTIPAKLNVTPIQLKSPEFVAPTQEEISASDPVVVVANTEQLFYYIACCCGGNINEGEAVKSNAMYLHSSAPVTAEYKISFKNSANGGSASDTTLKPFFHVAKRKLALKENVIPYRTFTNVPLANMSQADKTTLNNFISARFEKTGKGDNSGYATLIEKHQQLVAQDGDKYRMTFLDNAELLSAAELKAADWGTATYQNNKEVKTMLSDYPMPVYTSSISEKTGLPTYKYQSANLGTEGHTLADLAAEYPAAARAIELGVTDAEIVKMITESKNAEAAAKKSTRKSSSVKSESSLIPASDFGATFLFKLADNQDLGNGFDTTALTRSLNAISYKH